ncbi:GNAT family N-acetyltransferase [Streptomyces griseoincarnatus]
MELTLVDVMPGERALVADVAPLICALRPRLTPERFVGLAAEAYSHGLVYTGVYREDGRCVGVAGHRITSTSRGRVLVIDDLVIDPELRSCGIGARLMDALVERARRAGCASVELDSGVANHGAHRFYHARSMAISAFHFALEIE